MSVDSYLDPATGVLTNKPGIADAELLRQVVADISAARLHIESYAASEFAKLAKARHLRALALPDFVQKLAHYHTEINEIHPFREGNGRAQRSFLRQLAAEAGYRLDWTTTHHYIDADENIQAAVAAHRFRAITSPAADRKGA